jgi:hypothetical protein
VSQVGGATPTPPTPDTSVLETVVAEPWLSPGALARARALIRSSYLVLGVWAAFGLVLADITGRVTDWFSMTDELLYERYAISLANGSFPLPKLRGVTSHAFDQLYPLLLAPFFRHGLVPHDLHEAHVVNAWVMSSACVPAFLLARRVTGRLWPAYLLGVLSLCLPWMVFAPFLLTEVAAYPAFLWALLAAQAALDSPSRRNDVLALVAMLVAFYARTQLVVVFFVLPVALLAYEAGRPSGQGRRSVASTVTRALSRHRVLTAAYAVFVVVGAALAAAGRLHSLLGVYGSTIQGQLLPTGTGRGFAQNLATVALVLGILPLVVGTGWLLANVVRPAERTQLNAFACLGTVTIGAIALEGAVFDVRLGVGDIVFDRYLFYLAPVALLAFVCALRDHARPRWSLLLPAALVVAGFADHPLPTSGLLDTDTVAAVVNDSLIRSSHSVSGARVTLVVTTVLALVVFVVAARLVPHRVLTAVMVACLVIGLPLETRYAFTRLFDRTGWSGRPLTLQQGGVFDWIDRAIGTRAAVTMLPFPQNPDDYFSSSQYWEDVEFWNKSVDRAAYTAPGVYDTATGNSFPKLYIHFDPQTGLADISPTAYAAQSDRETRFRLRGDILAVSRDSELIEAGKKWRADWLSFGLYDDGWTKPGATATIRVFPAPGQRGPVTRGVSVGIAPGPGADRRSFSLRSNLGRWSGVARNGAEAPGIGGTTFLVANVCVPAHGYGDIHLRVAGSGAVPGDMANLRSFSTPRRGGAYVSQIALADEIGLGCASAHVALKASSTVSSRPRVVPSS